MWIGLSGPSRLREAGLRVEALAYSARGNMRLVLCLAARQDVRLQRLFQDLRNVFLGPGPVELEGAYACGLKAPHGALDVACLGDRV